MTKTDVLDMTATNNILEIINLTKKFSDNLAVVYLIGALKGPKIGRNYLRHCSQYLR